MDEPTDKRNRRHDKRLLVDPVFALLSDLLLPER
jgi:hypothetical protein